MTGKMNNHMNVSCYFDFWISRCSLFLIGISSLDSDIFEETLNKHDIKVGEPKSFRH